MKIYKMLIICRIIVVSLVYSVLKLSNVIRQNKPYSSMWPKMEPIMIKYHKKEKCSRSEKIPRREILLLININPGAYLGGRGHGPITFIAARGAERTFGPRGKKFVWALWSVVPQKHMISKKKVIASADVRISA